MNIIFTATVLFSASVCGSGLEATEGQDVTIVFQIPELLRADDVRIIQTRTGNQKSLVARLCLQQEGCDPINRPGVQVQVEGETLSLTLQNVNSSGDSGLYEVEVFNGKHFTKGNITLIVHPVFPSIPPTQVQTPKPPDFSERQRIYVLIPLLVFIAVVVLVGCLILQQTLKGAASLQQKSCSGVPYHHNCALILDQSEC